MQRSWYYKNPTQFCRIRYDNKNIIKLCTICVQQVFGCNVRRGRLRSQRHYQRRHSEQQEHRFGRLEIVRHAVATLVAPVPPWDGDFRSARFCRLSRCVLRTIRRSVQTNRNDFSQSWIRRKTGKGRDKFSTRSNCMGSVSTKIKSGMHATYIITTSLRFIGFHKSQFITRSGFFRN